MVDEGDGPSKKRKAAPSDKEEALIASVKKVLFSEEAIEFFKQVFHISECHQAIESFRGEVKEINDRIELLTKELAAQQLRVSDLEAQIKKRPQPTTATNEDPAEVKERNRSVVIINVPESRSKFEHEKNLADLSHVQMLFRYLDVGCSPMAVYRLGRPRDDGRSRLLKVIMPCSQSQRAILSKAKTLRSFVTAPHPPVFIRKSLSREELEKQRLERALKFPRSDPTSVDVEMQPAASALPKN
ncbi:hypothetical protein GCK72_015620 [Caenorhabditis remanei]|uniref:Uncharacterized protein n=1 Tax=Caenorhabditis remanei TaxID=31234 RepID=A0A6A5GX69_CAERE|nr:hypothetical protein GCK72_015620 [Caenorhabditis remanei]KAF1759159.1 hypothetical protein GCK72_015620 [Caenorhabditis remanei]